MLNITNGHIQFHQKCVILKPGLKEDEFRRSDLYNDVYAIDEKKLQYTL